MSHHVTPCHRHTPLHRHTLNLIANTHAHTLLDFSTQHPSSYYYYTQAMCEVVKSKCGAAPLMHWVFPKQEAVAVLMPSTDISYMA